MSAEQIERRPIGLRGVMPGVVRTISEQSSELMQRVVQALKDGEQIDVTSLTAAFDLNANLSRTLKEFLENQGKVVFPEGQPIKPSAIDGEGDKIVDSLITELSSLHEGPRTFGELLREKIDSQLLPPDKDSFKKSELFEAAKNKGAVRKAAAAEGFKAQKNIFTREETMQILYRFFITPAGNFKNIKESYSLQEIRKSFPMTEASINALSQEINYDCAQNPTIDYQTAMELRGLVNLEKILTGEKAARKGRPGAQFGRKPTPDPSTVAAIAFSDQP